MCQKKYYAYSINNGEIKGTTDTWAKCEMITKGKKARFKGFITREEASAWLKKGAEYTPRPKEKKPLQSGIYFDAGTGRGIGVEVRVTDETGKSLLDLIAEPKHINEFGNYLTPAGSTNNYGELVGCYSALKIALQQGIKNIFGDSKLVIEYWSNGHAKLNELPDRTVKLIGKVKELKYEFERKGGVIDYISGDINPADLGFHK